MLVYIGGAVAVLIGAFILFVATREGKFRFVRSGVIAAPPEKIYPYISQFERGQEWSPYADKDPKMKTEIRGTDGEIGAEFHFEGNVDAGAGILRMLKIDPPQGVDIELTMIKPFKAVNLVEYRLKPEEGGTRFTWTMSGETGFIGKFINVMIDCEKMIAGDFEKGIANLKAKVESSP